VSQCIATDIDYATELAKFVYGGLGFRLEPIFITALTASINEAQFKSGQNRLKNNHLAIHSV